MNTSYTRVDLKVLNQMNFVKNQRAFQNMEIIIKYIHLSLSLLP